MKAVKSTIAVSGLALLIVSGCTEKKASDPVKPEEPAGELPVAPAAAVAPEAPAAAAESNDVTLDSSNPVKKKPAKTRQKKGPKKQKNKK
jgi:hypothetical protein